MVKLSTHKSFKLAATKAKSVAVKAGMCISIKHVGAKYQVWGGAK